MLDAVGHVNGISQVSSTKIWIARPSPPARQEHDPHRRLGGHFEARDQHDQLHAHARRSPGLRRGPADTRTNLVGKRTAPIERIDGHCRLDHFHPQRIEQQPAADSEVLKELAERAYSPTTRNSSKLILEAIRSAKQENKKAGPKAAGQKPGKGEKPSAAGPKAAAEQNQAP